MNNASTYWGLMWNFSANDWRLGYGGTTSQVGWNLRWDNGSTVWANGSFRAPLFYDSDNTEYYADPNGGSYMRGIFNVAGGHGNTSIKLIARGNEMGTGQQSQLQMWVSEPGNTWNEAGFGFNVDNNLNSGGGAYYFGRPNTSFGQAYMRFTTGGTTIFYNTNTSGTRQTTMEWYADSTVYANNYLTGGNSLRAPIFYDSNNTGYYVDPAGTARLSYVVANGGIRIDGNENLYLDNNYGQSVVGVYTSTRYQGVFAMGNAYKLSIDGASTNNHYGIAWSHPNAGGQASYLNDHGMLIQNYGTTFAAISSRIWARSSMMSPIYYDHDTGYYGDFNSDTNWQGLTTYGKMRIGETAKTNWRRNDYTGNSDYWVGTMGWGTRDFNEVMTWGSGFIDTWSNPANQPSGTSHWVGVQTYHYTNAYNSAYGWQLVGGPIGNLRFRQSWPNAGGWRTVAMHDINDGSGGGLYAGAFYDANDTGYYLDPNGVDNQGLRMRGGTLHGPNWSWGKYLRVGTNGRIDGNASVVTTNGNLHLDCENGYETYINHYSGNRTYTYELRSTFIYDYNNTGYYLNMDGVSQLHYVLANNWFRPQGCTGVYWESYGRGIWSPECEGNPYGTIATYGGGRNGWLGYGITSRFCWMGRGGDVGLHDNSYGWIYYAQGDGIWYLRWRGNDRMSIQPYGMYVNNDIRSPIFYDHDTGYYGDFNSTSRFNYIINNNIYCYDWIFAQGNIIAYYSDERLKTKVGNIENALEKVSQLNGFYYVNNELAHSVGYTDTKVQLGLSAQEVQSILPEIVHLAPFDTDIDSETKEIKGSKSGENYLTIDYDKLVPLLVEAIKEQQTIIEKQNNEISEIKEMLKTLFDRK
jgi:hypothetical protein